MTVEIKGQCLCGVIKYSIADQPKEVGHCYCKQCQLISGSDHLVYVAFDLNKLNVSGPVTWYSMVGDSGLVKKHGFCSKCGSTLFGTAEYWPDLVVVYAGSLLDSSSIQPEVNIWVQSAPKWSCIDDQLKSFDKNPG